MTTLPRSKPRATMSIQTLLLGFDGPPVSIAAVFGSVGTSVAGSWPPLNDAVVVVVVVVVTGVVVVVVVDELSVVVLDEDELSVVVVVDELLVVEDELLDVVVVVVPSQPWLRVSTALPSRSPSYVTKTLPLSPAVRSPISCQPVANWKAPWPFGSPWTSSPSTLIQTFEPSPVQIQSWPGVLFSSHSTFLIAPFSTPLPCQYWVWSAARTTLADWPSRPISTALAAT